MTFLDRLFLFRHKITAEHKVSDKCRIYIDSENKNLVLKFSYTGNIQYHVVGFEEANDISKTINSILIKGNSVA